MCNVEHKLPKVCRFDTFGNLRTTEHIEATLTNKIEGQYQHGWLLNSILSLQLVLWKVLKIAEVLKILIPGLKAVWQRKHCTGHMFY